MKKNLILSNYYAKQKKLIKIMKCCLIFILVGMGACFATESYSQRTFFSVEYENQTIKEIIRDIEQNSEYIFFYLDNSVDLNRKVTIKVEHEGIEKILDELFAGTNTRYYITDRQIIISSKKTLKEPLPAFIEVEVEQPGIPISGTVNDESGPLPGVNVMIKGTTQGTATDMAGRYTINVPDRNAVLVFSYVGYVSLEMPVGSQTTINVQLVEDTQAFDEVVVVGYGTQKRSTLTGSISDIKSDKLTVAPIANITHALAGQLPGLVSILTGGRPGEDIASLYIRGFGNPLVIVDGVESSFTNLDPSQIESISILKDGAASIYGARAGNGVILVTTKRGIDSKPTITLNSSYSLEGFVRKVKPASSGQWAQMQREIHLNQGLPEATAPWSQQDVDKFFEGNDPAYVNSDWYDFITRKFAPLQIHNLSIRGGSERIKYYGFAGYQNQETMVKEKGGSFQRFNIQSNIDAKISQYLTMNVDFSLIYENHFFPLVSSSDFLWNYIYASQPWYPTTLPDPTKIPFAGVLPRGSAYAAANYDLCGYSNAKRRNLRAGASLEYDFGKYIKGLKAKAYVNYRDDQGYQKDFERAFSTYTYNTVTQEYNLGSSQEANLGEGYSTGTVFTQQYSLNYENIFNENHRLSALVLFESINYYNTSLSGWRTGFMSNAVDQIFAGSSVGQLISGSTSEMGRVSYIGRLNYSYRDKYLLETILRADASAKFDARYRWGYFPSISVGWVLSQESFMQNISFLEHLKLRASYGQSGDDSVVDFEYLSGYAISPSDSYLFEGSENTIHNTTLANPLLSWEKMAISNAGVDFTFTNRKLYGTAEYFYRDRTGIPATRVTTLPSTFGAGLPVENLNHLSTRGFELMLGTVQRAGEVTFDVSGNISWWRARWEYYEEPEYDDPDQRRINKRTGRWTDIGFSMKSDGLFTSQSQIDALPYVYNETTGNSLVGPGDVRLLDLNNDGLLNWRDVYEVKSSDLPNWMYGLNVMMKYRNFDLNALFQGAFGFTRNMVYRNDYLTDKQYEFRWTETNNDANALVPRMGTRTGLGDYTLKTVSYIRLKNLSLGYELPGTLLSKAGIAKLRIYVAGTNLLTLSNVNKYGMDPEGEIYTNYPQQRTYSIGLNLSF